MNLERCSKLAIAFRLENQPPYPPLPWAMARQASSATKMKSAITQLSISNLNL